MTKSFERVQGSVLPINVIARIGSGKSTLINALIRKNLLPYQSYCLNSPIITIIDNKKPFYSAVVYDENDKIIQEIPEIDREIMSQLNFNEKVRKICVKGDIPVLDSRSTSLMLVDTPFAYYALNRDHMNIIYRAINNDSQNLILYVLNAGCLFNNDDSCLLSYISEQMQRCGKWARDHLLFVITKMDVLNPETDEIGKVIQAVKDYLARFGIDEPLIFPCSAYTALNIRTYLADVDDINNLTRMQMRAFPIPARDVIITMDKFFYSYIDCNSGEEVTPMYLEQYSTISSSAQRELNSRLKEAIDNHDTKTQALIHSGICSIEAAIADYVKRFYKT